MASAAVSALEFVVVPAAAALAAAAGFLSYFFITPQKLGDVECQHSVFELGFESPASLLYPAPHVFTWAECQGACLLDPACRFFKLDRSEEHLGEDKECWLMTGAAASSWGHTDGMVSGPKQCPGIYIYLCISFRYLPN